jgi:hypothetical protein
MGSNVRLAYDRPNGWSISLYKISDSYGTYFVVYESVVDGYGDYDGEDAMDFDTEAEARKYYEKRVEFLRDTPNWEAQSAYDELHGTINGVDPGIVEWRELVGE